MGKEVSLPPSPADAARIFALATNLVLVAVVLPFFLGRPDSWLFALLALLPLAIAAIGVVIMSPFPRGATWSLLCIFPLSIGAVLAFRPTLEATPSTGLISLLLAGLSFALYGGVATSVLARPRGRTPSLERPLGADAPVGRHVRDRRGAQRVLIAVMTFGAVCIAVVAPLLGPSSWLGEEWTLEERWAGGTTDIRVLTLAVFGTLGAVVIGFFLAPSLRRSRERLPTRKERRARAFGFLLPAAMGGVFYALFRFLS